MLKIINDDIHLTRGDTAHIAVPVYTMDGATYTLKDGDRLFMTVRQTTNSDDIIFQKTADEVNRFTIQPNNTSSLPYGCYVYDICLIYASGDVNTIVEPHVFEVCGEVTW